MEIAAHVANNPSDCLAVVEPQDEPPPKSPRGFASLSPERRREIAQMGGLASQASGYAHKFTSDEARAAGHKGGRSVSTDRAHMARIGRKGGVQKGIKRRSMLDESDVADTMSSPSAASP